MVSVSATVAAPSGWRRRVAPNTYVWLPVIETFVEEIRFGAENEAVAWELTDRVEIDPNIQFGEPVVKGTRLPIAVIARELVSHSVELRVHAYLGRGVDVILCTRPPSSPPRAARTHRLELPTLAGGDRGFDTAPATVAPAPAGRPQGRPNLNMMVSGRYRRGAMSSENSQ